MADAVEALKAALGMRNWSGVIKYATQLQSLEQDVYRIENVPPRGPSFADSMRTAGHKHGRGRLP